MPAPDHSLADTHSDGVADADYLHREDSLHGMGGSMHGGKPQVCGAPACAAALLTRQGNDLKMRKRESPLAADRRTSPSRRSTSS